MVCWSQDRGLAKKMRMIQEQIEREQKEAEARIPKAQPLPYTTKSPIVRIFHLLVWMIFLGCTKEQQ